jgi:uncharacterized membrane protein
MTERKSEWNDERMDRIVSVILRSGVLISSLVVLAGGIFYLVQYGRSVPDFRIFRGEPSDLRHLRRIVTGALSFHGRNWMQFGLLLLVATPVVRVAFSVFAFFKERDWTYVALTLIVLFVLVSSFWGR